MVSFITPQELRTMPLPVTTAQWRLVDELDGDKIQWVCDTASENIRDFLERDIELLSYVERIQGANRNRIMLNNYPVVSITSVTSTDVYGSVTSYNSSDFLINNRSGIIEWVDKYRNTFSKAYLWTISYTAGYAEIPKVIKQATALQAIEILSPLFRGGTNFAQTALVDDLNEQIVDLIDRYKRNRIG